MNTSSNQPNKISEADMDRLLTNFFLQEMPLEFRVQSSATNSVATDTRTSSTRTVWIVLATTAAALMFAVIAFQSTADRASNPAGSSYAKTPLIPTDTVTPVTDRIETEEGTIEMKTWLTSEKDTEDGMDLRGFHFEYDVELELDDDDESVEPEVIKPETPEPDVSE